MEEEKHRADEGIQRKGTVPARYAALSRMRNFEQLICGRNLQRRRRIIVFVDDLDRCSEDSIMQVCPRSSTTYLVVSEFNLCDAGFTCTYVHAQVLEAINLVLAKCRMTTVLGVATDMLYRAIRSHYSSKSDKKGSDTKPAASESTERLGYILPLDIQQARKYLEKIVQVSNGRLLFGCQAPVTVNMCGLFANDICA